MASIVLDKDGNVVTENKGQTGEKVIDLSSVCGRAEAEQAESAVEGEDNVG